MVPRLPKRQICELFILVLCSGLAACSNDEDDSSGSPDVDTQGTASIEPIEANVKTTVPLGYAASVAMAAVDGQWIPNASASGECSVYPCLATVSITLSPGDLPVGLDEYGEIFVAGLWSGPGQAVMTTSFNSFDIGSANNVVLKISTFPVVTDSSGDITVAYASVDINIDSEPNDTILLSNDEVQAELERVNTSVSDDPEVNVNMDAWVIRIQTQGTDAFDDDAYLISGGGQYVGVSASRTSVIQLGLAGMRVTSACDRNPVAGLAVLNELDVSSQGSLEDTKIGAATFQFQSDCDGTARILAAVGTYGIYIDDEIGLNL